MKALVITVLSASLVLPAALDLAAQTRTAPGDTKQDMTRDRDRAAWAKPEGAMESKKLIGARIKDAEGKDVGEIEQLIVSQTDGKVSHVVVGMGGLAGIGEKKVVVPWSDVKVRWDRDKAVVTMDRAVLDRAPRYEAVRATDRTPAASPSTTPSTTEPRKSY